MTIPTSPLLARLCGGALGAGLLMTAGFAGAASADPKSPDCVLITAINNEAGKAFGSASTLSVASRLEKAFNIFREHVAQAQGKAKDEAAQAALADVTDSSNEISDLLDQIKADPGITSTRDYVFTSINVNEHRKAAGAGLDRAQSAVCG